MRRIRIGSTSDPKGNSISKKSVCAHVCVCVCANACVLCVHVVSVLCVQSIARFARRSVGSACATAFPSFSTFTFISFLPESGRNEMKVNLHNASVAPFRRLRGRAVDRSVRPTERATDRSPDRSIKRPRPPNGSPGPPIKVLETPLGHLLRSPVL